MTLDLVCLALIFGFLFTISLGARDLWNPNEPTYGRAVVEMHDRGDWMMPTVNGRVFSEKPILYYWSALLAAEVTGEVDEFSLRLPAAIAGVGAILLTYLLVFPYAGRRRALWAAALLGSSYQVFWASRTIQMDILVLLSTLGVLVPLTRKLDFGMRSHTAWGLAGIAAGLGFAAKGPVTWVVPCLAITAYAASENRLSALYDRWCLFGGAVALALASPWYVALWARGEIEFLYEVLYRQNFSRFTDAWDHIQPWWYYLEYLWIDYLPWAWLLPAAWLAGRDSTDEADRSLRRFAWLWILVVIFFFSLSDSKRAPYILPISPAIAILVAAVFDRWQRGEEMGSGARRSTRAGLFLLTSLFTVSGIAASWLGPRAPELIAPTLLALGALLVLSSALLWAVLIRAKRWAPTALLATTCAVYFFASVWALPRWDALKSAQEFARQVDQVVSEEDGRLASYSFWEWRAGYSYYADRDIEPIQTAEELRAFWRAYDKPYILVEKRGSGALEPPPVDGATTVLQETVGGRTTVLYAKEATSPQETVQETVPRPGGGSSDNELFRREVGRHGG